MELLSTWRTLYKLRYCPVTLIQTAFSAGTVYLLIAMQASSGTRIAQKELRHSLDQETLVQQYLQEMGLSWHCATNISVTLRNLMTAQVRPLLDLMDRRNVSTNPGLHISADTGNDEENNSSRSRSSSRKRPKLAPQISHPHTMSSGSGQSSLSTSPNHISTSTFPIQVPPPTKHSVSSTVAISSAANASSTQAPSAPTATQSSFSNPPSFTETWVSQVNPDSNPTFNYLPSSSAHPEFALAFSNSTDDPFSGNCNSSSDDVENAFGSLVSFLAHNFHPSPSSEYLGMLGGQTLPEAPFVGWLGGVEDTHSPNLSNSLQALFGAGFPNQFSSTTSLGEHVPSSFHGGKDKMDLDTGPWMLTS